MAAFAHLPGLGEEDLPGFSAEECEALPDLLRHFNLACDVLRAEPGLFEAMAKLKTPKWNLSFARCIKTGLDNRGHPMIKSVGAIAGDAECYETFRPFFDKLAALCHEEATLPSAGAVLEVPKDMVLGSYLRVFRNLEGLPFVPAMHRVQRHEVERCLVKALLEEGGDYFPLTGSESYPAKPKGMTHKEEQLLARYGALFREPDSPALLATGAGRHWPHGRGIFLDAQRKFTIWINEEEHFKLMAERQDANLQLSLLEVTDFVRRLETRCGGFAHSERLGYLTTSPQNLGLALSAGLRLKLPMLKFKKRELAEWCKARNLVVRPVLSSDCLEVSHRLKLGVKPEDLIADLTRQVCYLCRAEQLMEYGASVEQALQNAEPREVLTPIGDAEEDAEDKWAASAQHLEAIFSDAVDAHEMEGVKVKLGQQLVAAYMEDGLTPARWQEEEEAAQAEAAKRIQAIQRGRQQRKDAKPSKKAPSKAQMRSQLEQALENGSLEQMLQARQPQQQQLRQKVADQLLAAAEDGRLDAAMQSQQVQLTRIESLRSKAAASLMAAAEDGRLESALSAPKEEACVGTDSLELIRSNMAASMLEALETGKLEEAFQNEEACVGTDSLELIRSKMAASMLEALETGKLEEAFRNTEEGETTIVPYDVIAEAHAVAVGQKETPKILLQCDAQLLQTDQAVARIQLQLDAEEVKRVRLQEGKQQLMDQLDMATLEQKHAQIDLGGYSQNISAVCGYSFSPVMPGP
ncbi:unnamed protein product [Effrenium voratum]|nr:unnamed protein product [Effrenium voratum]